MGIVRLIMALAVVLGHVHWVRFIFGPIPAVEVFFLISGFLISLILRNDAAYRSTFTFYKNRALRIFPIYWVTSLVSFLLLLTQPGWWIPFAKLNTSAQALLITSETFLFGQDWVMLLEMKGNALRLALDFSKSHPPLWRFLLVPPAWSLGVELTFYLIAPFVVRRTWLVICLATLSLLSKIYAWHSGLNFDPWSYRFFPFEIWIFLTGALVERFWFPVVKTFQTKVRTTEISLAIAITTILLFPLLDISYLSKSLALIGIMALCLPGLAMFQRSHKWDVLIGDLSFPLYISHWPVTVVFTALTSGLPHSRSVVFRLFIIPTAILVAVLLERGVARPVERLRKKIRLRSAPIDMLDRSTPEASTQ